MLKIRNLTHRYGENTVLNNISLTLAPGERIALMGPSGCGKTTLLRLALGLLKPAQGQIENSFQKTGVVFQEPRLLSWRTALENVNLVLGDKAATLPQAGEWLSRMELEEAAGKYPRELSGGMQQRTSLARALAIQPELLVLDEPFRGLDEALKDRILRQVHTADAAILLVTHDPAEALALGCEIMTLP